MSTIDRARRWIAILLAIYSSLVLLVAAIPRPLDRGPTPRIRGVLAFLHRHGLRDWIDYEFVEYALHVVLFIPLGILAVVAIGRRLAWLAVLLGLGVCAVTEVASATFSSDTSPSLADFILNAAGMLVGAVIGFVASRPTAGVTRAIAPYGSRGS